MALRGVHSGLRTTVKGSGYWNVLRSWNRQKQTSPTFSSTAWLEWQTVTSLYITLNTALCWINIFSNLKKWCDLWKVKETSIPITTMPLPKYSPLTLLSIATATAIDAAYALANHYGKQGNMWVCQESPDNHFTQPRELGDPSLPTIQTPNVHNQDYSRKSP